MLPEIIAFTPQSVIFNQVATLLYATWPETYTNAAVAATKISRHATHPGFKGLAALANNQVVGLNYGYTNLPGQWWHDRIAHLLDRRTALASFTGAFAYTELAIDPDWRGQGLAHRLHNQLLASLPHQQAVLSTQLWNTPARRLYASLGWQTLIERMRFPNTADEFTILTRHLQSTGSRTLHR